MHKIFAVILLCGCTWSLAAQSDALSKADLQFRAGVSARAAGDLAQAEKNFAEAVRLAPKNATAHAAYGAVLLERQQLPAARHEFLRAEQLDPQSASNAANLAYAELLTADNQRSSADFARALMLENHTGQQPVSAVMLENYTRALAATGQLEEAARIEQLAIERGSDRADVWDALGSIRAQLHQWEKARIAFAHALSMDSEPASYHLHLGIVLRELGDAASALRELELARSRASHDPLVALEYGRTLVVAGRDEDALAPLREAASALDLAMALQRLGRQAESIPLFEQAIAQDPANVSTLTNLGLALTLTGKAKEALPYFDRALKSSTAQAVIWKDRGVAHIQLSAFDEAIADFQQAIRLDASDPQLHYDLGLAYKFKDRVDEAVQELTQAGQMDPQLQDPPYTLGILLMQIGRLDESVVELNKAVALSPNNGDAWAILGSTLKQAQRLDEARIALEHAVPLLPAQPGPRVTLAAVLSEQASARSTAADAAEAAGNTAQATTLRAEVRQLRASAAEYRRQGAELARSAVNRQKANFALNAGNQLMLRGEIAAAVARYQESIAADATLADAHTQLAVALERQGRREEAQAERQEAARLSAKN